MARKVRRCAIYTRKSTDDGLDQEFNSLDAQREACEAYIASQRSEGWKALPDRYDDGGVSGGTLERDAIQQLLDDVDACKIDIVVVYKIDRLTRSLADFAKIVERFEKHDVSFVSVTQSFNTSSSMGRLTLNVLLSFAQFEREVTAERIRDKIAASKKKGMWMGGFVPLGYDTIDRKLIVNKNEAGIVRSIFKAYADGLDVRELANDLDARGIRSKARPNGMGGKPFSRGALYKILSNPIYRGDVVHRGRRYPGVHDPVIDDATWAKAEARLAAGKRRAAGNAHGEAPLARKVFADGEALTPTHTKNHGRRYRYLVSQSLVESGASDSEGWRLPVAEVETAVAKALRHWLEEQQQITKYDAVTSFQDKRDQERLAAQLTKASTALETTNALNLWTEAIIRIDISEEAIRIALDPAKLTKLGLAVDDDQPIEFEAPVHFKRRGVGRKMIIGDATVRPDPAMIKLIKLARRWRVEIFESGASLKDLAARDGVDQGDASRFLPLAFLAPDITLEILEGRQPVSLTAETLKRLPALPLAWSEQRKLLSS